MTDKLFKMLQYSGDFQESTMDEGVYEGQDVLFTTVTKAVDGCLHIYHIWYLARHVNLNSDLPVCLSTACSIDRRSPV